MGYMSTAVVRVDSEGTKRQPKTTTEGNGANEGAEHPSKDAVFGSVALQRGKVATEGRGDEPRNTRNTRKTAFFQVHLPRILR